MSTTTLIIICYFVQIPLAIFGLFFMPRRGTLATPLENGRRNSALLGLLPCALASILIQVIFLGIYYGRVKAIERKENAIARGFSNSGGSAVTGDGNPFGAGMPAGQGPSLPTHNPFSTGGGLPGGGGSGMHQQANPFGDRTDGPPPASPRGNPFA